MAVHQDQTPRLRLACDTCHGLKVRCSGSMPCDTCSNARKECFYSLSSRVGRPRGSRNKRQPKSATGSSRAPSTSGSTNASAQSTARRNSAKAGAAWGAAKVVSDQDVKMADVPAKTPLAASTPAPATSPTEMMNLSSAASLGAGAPASAAWGIAGLDGSYGSTPLGLMAGPASAEAGANGSSLLGDWGADHSTTELVSEWIANFVTPQDPVDYSYINLHDLGRGTFLPDAPPSSTTTTMPPPKTEPHTTTTHRKASVTLPSPSLSTGDRDSPHTRLASQPPSDDESAALSSCACLRQLTSLLCDLKQSGASTASETPPLDAVFLSIQGSISSLTKVLGCARCAANTDQEVLMLAVMCIKCAVGRLRPLPPHVREEMARPRGYIAETTVWTAVSLADTSESRDQLSPSASIASLDIDDVPMYIGGFQVTGNDKAILLNVLLTVTIRKLETVVASLRETIRRERQAGVTSGTLDLVKQMTDELAHTIKTLQ